MRGLGHGLWAAIKNTGMIGKLKDFGAPFPEPILGLQVFDALGADPRIRMRNCRFERCRICSRRHHVPWIDKVIVVLLCKQNGFLAFSAWVNHRISTEQTGAENVYSSAVGSSKISASMVRADLAILINYPSVVKDWSI